MILFKLNLLFFAARVETIPSINGLKDVIVVKKWGSGEIGATYYYYHNDYSKLGKTFKTGEVKTKAAIAQNCITLREIKPVIFRTNNKTVHPNFRDALFCCFHLGFQKGLNLGFKIDAYQIEADLTWSDFNNAGFRLRESDDQKRHVDVGVFAEENYTYVNRAFTDQPDETNQFVESTAPFDASKKKVHLKILVDKTSIEVFVDDGKAAYSNLIFPHAEDKGITLFSEGGKAIFKNVKVTHFDSIN
ncbi:Glycosyl hydrolases family 32 C terminal [Peribacillus simplex]|uniref:Glycosyl hydrolases family 32 C terminal n=1 Tax=Peribacillus simplex TaxID=1478 RepID=A0A9X8RA62_9BACI|nr:Glycosyl hydrolases family 32 C terminal [Peribacillus simplex]